MRLTLLFLTITYAIFAYHNHFTGGMPGSGYYTNQKIGNEVGIEDGKFANMFGIKKRTGEKILRSHGSKNSKKGERTFHGNAEQSTETSARRVKIIDPKNKYKEPYANYAYEISQGNEDFLKTLIAESGLRPDAVNTRNRSGYRDIGLCQINRQYHSKFIDSPAFKDWKKQIDYCWGVYQDGIKRGKIATTFYGYNYRNSARVKAFYQLTD